VGQVARAQVANPELVVAPVRRESDAIGVLAAGGASSHGEHGMSSVERALVETAASHLAVFLDNARLYRDLDGMFMGALSALVSAIDAKDPYTRGHSQRVALLSRQIAEAAGLSAGEVKQAHIAGLVHDVGKIGVPESILRKQGRLDDDEFAQIKEHPETGFRILRDIPQFAPVLGGVRHHHERYDGLGYPHGISGESIPLLARVIAIADTFDAMSSTRTYRSARPRPQVLAEIARCAGNQLDPALVPVFLSLDLRAYDAMSESHGSGHRFTGREAA
jgi:HD-GYP domain-containing protein (c-di-GMP phosphodiesterase class II)